MARSVAVNEGVDCAAIPRGKNRHAATRSLPDRSSDVGMMKNLPNTLRPGALVAAIVLAAAACERFAAERHRSQAGGYAATDSMGVPVRDIATVPLRGVHELVENSAAAMSRRQPGVLFTINDSGNEPLLFAIDTLGASRGIWRIVNASNVDWESASVGPCRAPAGDACVYVGDTGDNNAAHASRVIYRVREPDATGRRATLSADALRYVYADGPHDVEAMYVAPNGDILLITKRPLAARAAILRPALMYVLPESSWARRERVTAQLVDSVPIVPGSAPLRAITDAALSPDGRHLAVRTYAQIYVFSTDSGTGRVDHRVAPRVCNIIPLNEMQGEGVTWADNAGRLAFTSEGQGAPLHLGNCPIP
jgi:hypothetical protein